MTLRLTGLALCLLITANGCDSGGGSGGGIAGGGVTGTGSAEGTISAFGSIFVNGIRWDTDSADIFVDENAGAEAQLRIGQRVKVFGTADGAAGTGVATRVEYDDLLQGPITTSVLNTDGDERTLTIFGRTVRVVDGFTSFEDTTFATISVGDVVEVSGIEQSSGVILATWIDREGSVGSPFEAELSGEISNLDTTAETFEIGGVPIAYSATGTDIDLDGAALANGLRVEVEGMFNGGTLEADEIDLEDEFDDDDDQDFVSIEGAISGFVNASTPFQVGGVTVDATAAIFFPDDVSLFTNDAVVRVEGSLVNGVVLADTVESRSSQVLIEAQIASAGAIDVNSGLFDLAGVVIVVDATTRFEDDNTQFELSDLQAGDFVEVRGSFDPASGRVFATRIEVEDDLDEVTIQGPLQSFTSTSLQILGLTIPFDAGTEFEDENDVDVPIAQILSNGNIGRVIKATDDGVNLTVFGVADEIELEDIDD